MKSVTHSDNYQRGYRYKLPEPVGKNFDPAFTPDLTPKELLKIGVFGGAYFIGVDGLIPDDLPKSWFAGVKLSHDQDKHKEYNYFGVRASQPRKVWLEKGWIAKEDPHGWFQWYCRYYLGRRLPEEDQRQIKRWKAIVRHVAQVKKNCKKGDETCRPRQRQALLHWAYDSRKL